MTPDELVQAKSRQPLADVAEEYGTIRRGWLASVTQHLAKQAGGLGP
ncbi:hypothetical protein MPL3365_170097 [Mesorhizobium plurifarium]|uniref:Uncharacterized protein n=1 Tax=Mesorhizobium plurifarium TaxID=69974 RepID=A0A090G5I0_MESPL|nr:hypothetical protein MPL3365_170097 [Mesorhizobium plurifarium]